MNAKKTTIWYFILSISVFLIFAGPGLFRGGMFMDGMMYATISRNLAQGQGSFWKPHFASVYFNAFYEHPPLAFGIQSLWFRIFGDSVYVERFYSLTMFLLTGYGMVLIWQQLSGSKKYAWVPLLLFSGVNVVVWAAGSNLLENTMAVFTTFSVLLYIISLKKHRFFNVCIAGLLLSLAWLTKGFSGLYIWVLPFLIFLFLRTITFRRSVTDTILIILFTILPLMFFYFLIPGAQANFDHYVTGKVYGSITATGTETRLKVLRDLFENSIIPVSLVLLAVLLPKGRKEILLKTKDQLPYSLVFIILVLAGTVPIMVSPVQRIFYSLTVYPFLSIGLAWLSFPAIIRSENRISEKQRYRQILKITSIFLLVISVILSIYATQRQAKRQGTIDDCLEIARYTGRGKTIGIDNTLYSDWGLHAIFARYGALSLDHRSESKPEYILRKKGDIHTLNSMDYQPVELNTTQFTLFFRHRTENNHTH